MEGAPRRAAPRLRLPRVLRRVRHAGAAPAAAAAGGAAHLPGMVASLTTLPDIGVPIESHSLKGLDSLLSIVQMPGGVPVGTMAIGKSGAINGALFSAAIVGLSNSKVAEALKEFRMKQTRSVPDTPESN